MYASSRLFFKQNISEQKAPLESHIGHLRGTSIVHAAYPSIQQALIVT
jgi:hypothetical protein